MASDRIRKVKPGDIQKLLKQIFQSLEGDWVLVGGALLHALKISERQTLDIDLVPLQQITNADQLKVIDIAIKNGFPPETINFAAEYFFKKQSSWKNEIILLKKTKKARIFRPSKILFRRLKEARGSETDQLDILLFEEKIKE